MPKKKRFRPRTSSSSAPYASSGGASRPRRPFRRRRPNGGAAPVGANGEPPEVVEGETSEASEMPLEEFVGILEMHPNGYGFLRASNNNYSRERTDPFVPGTMIEKFGLRQGVKIKAMMQQARRQQGPRVREILDVDGMPPDDYINVKSFDNDGLTPINPEQWLHLEVGPNRSPTASSTCWLL